MQIDNSTPFWDNSLTEEQRLDWLISNMTIEEKLMSLASGGTDIERLGIPGFSLGGEAAHGVEGRNDQNHLGEPDITTSFPQPIGMSATWDEELVREAGCVTGREARVVYHRHPTCGLSRWAPTVDLERDPRWGRTEEGYGEDPVLTGRMASAYVRGLKGDDHCYIRCAATLKHFYANNTEDGRGFKNASVDPRNREELYLEPFRRVIEYGGATGVMTAYNRINGIPGILNREVRDVLKGRYGLMHAVGDGGAMGLVNYTHHYYGMNGETLAAALSAGVDAMSDSPGSVLEAAKQAYELGLLSEEMMDEALRNTFRLKLRLGVYDRVPNNPFDHVTEKDINTKEAAVLCRKLTQESVVLLHNRGILPLSKEEAGNIALIGPLSDAWYQDWYGGEPPYRRTLRDGIYSVCGTDPAICSGLDVVRLLLNGRELAVSEAGTLYAVESGEGDDFERVDWGEGRITYRCLKTGRYMNCRMQNEQGDPEDMGRIAVEAVAPFDWFVMEVFYEEEHAGIKAMANRFHVPICLKENGIVQAIIGTDSTDIPAELTVKVVRDGLKDALSVAKSHSKVILALGCCSMIGAKEEIDRNTIDLPPIQQKLLEEITEVCDQTIVVLLCNYPYAMKQVEKRAAAVVWCATGSQEMGTGVADILFGDATPAGRLNMTWYRSDADLPDIDDYDIIRGKRTYRYFDKTVDYPFGYGLTYTTFTYNELVLHMKDEATIEAGLSITNEGNRMSDEVVQLYAIPPASRVPKPLKQLVAFTRVHDVGPGETRQIRLTVPVSELFFYDTVSGTQIVEEGEYTFFAGRSSADPALSENLFIPGAVVGCRETLRRIRADHYDDCEGIELVEGAYGYTAVRPRNDTDVAKITFRDCIMTQANELFRLCFKSERGCKIEVLIDGERAATFEGDTMSYDAHVDFRENSIREGTPMPERWPALYIEWKKQLPENCRKAGEHVNIEFRLTGDVKLIYWYMEKETTR